MGSHGSQVEFQNVLTERVQIKEKQKDKRERYRDRYSF